jgi:hypothetical protein
MDVVYDLDFLRKPDRVAIMQSPAPVRGAPTARAIVNAP